MLKYDVVRRHALITNQIEKLSVIQAYHIFYLNTTEKNLRKDELENRKIGPII